jgi:hypothetical protein
MQKKPDWGVLMLRVVRFLNLVQKFFGNHSGG